MTSSCCAWVTNHEDLVVPRLWGGCDLGDSECSDMVITEIPFSLPVRSSCCSCGSILPWCLFCTLLKTGRPISDVHDLPQNMRTNRMFYSAMFCLVELLCSIPRYRWVGSSSLCTVPLHTATSYLVTFIHSVPLLTSVTSFPHSASIGTGGAHSNW